MWEIWVFVIVVAAIALIVAQRVLVRRNLKKLIATRPEKTINMTFGKGAYKSENRFIARPKTPRSIYFLLSFFTLLTVVATYALISGYSGTGESHPAMIFLGLCVSAFFTLILSVYLILSPDRSSLSIYSVTRLDVPKLVKESLAQSGLPFSVVPEKPKLTTEEGAMITVRPSMKFLMYLSKAFSKIIIWGNPTTMHPSMVMEPYPCTMWPKVIMRLQDKTVNIDIVEYKDGLEGFWKLFFKPKIYKELNPFLATLEEKVLG